MKEDVITKEQNKRVFEMKKLFCILTVALFN